MPLSPGTRLGSYEILAPLGAGGMGEVYRGKDTRLDREVAIKILPDALAHDPERLARFEREAKVLASLNHPNIAQIYGIQESNGSQALIMELVEGQTLRGPMPVEQALRYAGQIAEALSAAHEKGITHRDLKPANIMITPAGMVKVLDFGLAAVARPSGAQESDPGKSPTLTISATQAGMILGTAAYMSPEQARGHSVDRRADIWAFGVVLWEMLTGKRLFSGDTVSDTLASVLKEHPDFVQAPAKVRRLLERCLEKDPRKRLQAIGDWDLLVETGDAAVVEKPPRPNLSGWIWPSVAGVFALAGLVLGLVSYRHLTEPKPEVIRFSVSPPEKGFFDATNGYVVAVSPDAKRIAFLATVDGKDQIWLQDLSSPVSRPLAGTENALGAPFWSPDGEFIGFFSGGKLKKIDWNGGPPQTLCDARPGRAGTWNRDNVIVFQPDGVGTLYQVSAAGGIPIPVTKLESSEDSHRFPFFLPDGHRFLYTAMSTTDSDKGAIYAGDLNGGARVRVLAGNTNAVYVRPGYLLFTSQGRIMAQRFDAGTLQVRGAASPVAEQVDYNLGNARAQFSAANGVLAYLAFRAGAQFQLTWFDRAGKELGKLGSPGAMNRGVISPDGKTVAVDRLQDDVFDLWLHDLERGSVSRFTFGPRANETPVWSPDGSRIAFESLRNAAGAAFQKAVAGTAQEEVLETPPGVPALATAVDDWSRDGRYVIEATGPIGKTGADVWVLRLFGDRKLFPYLQSEFNEGLARVSPDGKWLAYTSDESKRPEVYVQSFPEHGGKWQVSTNGGSHSVWSRDGKELYFVSPDGKMMAVEVQGGTNFEAGIPKSLFDAHFLDAYIFSRRWFDVSKDGKFLVPVPLEHSAAPMTVVVNWQAELKK